LQLSKAKRVVEIYSANCIQTEGVTSNDRMQS
jgi:hypothetical protein